MIKVKILNPTKGRNKPTFRPLLRIEDMLRDCGIDIVPQWDHDYDYLFVGMYDFIDKKKSLKESVEWGLENLSKITGDYFLFDGQDSTSLMGAYEVFEQSNAIYLFKNQLLNREEYKVSTSFNKWFFGSGSDLDLSYDIPDDKWDRIKLTGYNLGYLRDDYFNLIPINYNKHIDVCAIYQLNHKYNEDHKVRNDLLYSEHRENCLNSLSLKYNSKKGKLPLKDYLDVLYNSKVSISPFGMGEICFRDYEAMVMGTILIKPDMSKVNTYPNIYIDGETYISVDYDWKNLNEMIDYVLDNFKDLNEKINNNIRSNFKEKYTYENLCLYFYNIIKNLSGVVEET